MSTIKKAIETKAEILNVLSNTSNISHKKIKLCKSRNNYYSILKTFEELGLIEITDDKRKYTRVLTTKGKEYQKAFNLFIKYTDIL